MSLSSSLSSRSILAIFILLWLTLQADATEINGRCYPHPIKLGVNDQPPNNAALIDAANMEWVRITIPWRDVNTAPGAFTWTAVDPIVNAHFNRDHKILAVLSTAPQWAGSNGNGTHPPGTISDISLWEEFVRRTAIHFRGKIQAYEIWNEPNLGDVGVGVGWTGTLYNLGRSGQSPFYAQYVKAASTQIRTNAPGTLVVAPNTSSEPNSKTVEIFKSLESEGASPYIDVVSFHANGQSDDPTSDVLSHINSHYTTLQNRNPSNAYKPIWITEYGWATYFVSEASQSSRIQTVNDSLSFASVYFSPYAFCGYLAKTHLAFIYKDIDTLGSSDATRGIHRSNGAPKQVVSGYIQNLPATGVHPVTLTHNEGHQPFNVSCSGRTCTFISGYSNPAGRTFDWDFGDGSTAIGYQVVHTFPSSGQYHVFHGAVSGTRDWVTGGCNNCKVLTDAQIVRIP